jgi:ubiquinone/menaquinone biosynthesis C-methylase UbiE
MINKLNLLPKDLLINTNPIDHADWNYKPVLGCIQRKRFQLALSLIGNNNYDQILEIGYGSGIFMPLLSKHCNKLYGIDIHPFNDNVSKILLNYGIVTNLCQGSVSQMPFKNESFDLIVSISTLEFVENKKTACKEIRRVLKTDGLFIIITPGESWILDLGLKILTHETAKKDYGDKRQYVIPILKEYFDVFQSKIFPSVIGHLLSIYKAYVLVSKK